MRLLTLVTVVTHWVRLRSHWQSPMLLVPEQAPILTWALLTVNPHPNCVLTWPAVGPLLWGADGVHVAHIGGD